MKAVKLYKFQFFLYLFIIVFSLQHYFFKEYNYSFSFYENFVNIILVTSVITILLSIIILIVEGIISINRKQVIEIEMIYLVFNLILFYFLTISSLYLSGEIRP